jgi:serine/threonine-protein kinase RsbW
MLIKQMPARVESLHELLAFITAGAEKKGFSEDTINRIKLVAEEALVNVFVHAYGQSTGDVEVCCLGPEDQALMIEIRDTGVPFNPLERTEPDLQADLDERMIGGMGVFLVRKMTDQVTYRREGDSNILTLTFFNR